MKLFRTAGPQGQRLFASALQPADEGFLVDEPLFRRGPGVVARRVAAASAVVVGGAVAVHSLAGAGASLAAQWAVLAERLFTRGAARIGVCVLLLLSSLKALQVLQTPLDLQSPSLAAWAARNGLKTPMALRDSASNVIIEQLRPKLFAGESRWARELRQLTTSSASRSARRGRELADARLGGGRGVIDFAMTPATRAYILANAKGMGGAYGSTLPIWKHARRKWEALRLELWRSRGEEVAGAGEADALARQWWRMGCVCSRRYNAFREGADLMVCHVLEAHMRYSVRGGEALLQARQGDLLGGTGGPEGRKGIRRVRAEDMDAKGLAMSLEEGKGIKRWNRLGLARLSDAVAYRRVEASWAQELDNWDADIGDLNAPAAHEVPDLDDVLKSRRLQDEALRRQFAFYEERRCSKGFGLRSTLDGDLPGDRSFESVLRAMGGGAELLGGAEAQRYRGDVSPFHKPQVFSDDYEEVNEIPAGDEAQAEPLREDDILRQVLFSAGFEPNEWGIAPDSLETVEYLQAHKDAAAEPEWRLPWVVRMQQARHGAAFSAASSPADLALLPIGDAEPPEAEERERAALEDIERAEAAAVLALESAVPAAREARKPPRRAFWRRSGAPVGHLSLSAAEEAALRRRIDERDAATRRKVDALSAFFDRAEAARAATGESERKFSSPMGDAEGSGEDPSRPAGAAERSLADLASPMGNDEGLGTEPAAANGEERNFRGATRLEMEYAKTLEPFVMDFEVSSARPAPEVLAAVDVHRAIAETLGPQARPPPQLDTAMVMAAAQSVPNLLDTLLGAMVAGGEGEGGGGGGGEKPLNGGESAQKGGEIVQNGGESVQDSGEETQGAAEDGAEAPQVLRYRVMVRGEEMRVAHIMLRAHRAAMRKPLPEVPDMPSEQVWELAVRRFSTRPKGLQDAEDAAQEAFWDLAREVWAAIAEACLQRARGAMEDTWRSCAEEEAVSPERRRELLQRLAMEYTIDLREADVGDGAAVEEVEEEEDEGELELLDLDVDGDLDLDGAGEVEEEEEEFVFRP